MRHQGKLRTWHDDRGFGFIAPRDGGPELFVHISAFAQDGTRPTEGESLSYEVGPGRNGKPSAQRVMRLAVGPAPATQQRPVVKNPRSSTPDIGKLAPSREPSHPRAGSFIKKLMTAVMAGVVLALLLQLMPGSKAPLPSGPALAPPPAPAPAIRPMPVIPPAQGAFRCDGRTQCSQMRSCAEAEFFLRNCPGVQMDGDHDGIPCEQQWCTSPIAR